MEEGVDGYLALGGGVVTLNVLIAELGTRVSKSSGGGNGIWLLVSNDSRFSIRFSR